ncbi:MAG: hypothetical protein KatS3mg108_2657 [Isosphaeraceae bacterium]|nr:MAG: hypothetical protein KatS3mg108_2657 [Isosphaeraceae bacterium]
MRRFGVLCWAILVSSAGAGLCRGELITLRFDERPAETPLAPSVTVDGITFTYEGGPFAVYNSLNRFTPGVDAVHLDGSVLEGDTLGRLTIDFGAAALSLEFAVALSDFATYLPGFSIELFDPGLMSLGTFDVLTTQQVPGTGFSEGVFSFRGNRVRRAVLSFSPEVANTAYSFALDNLRAVVVPEPSGLVLVGSGVIGLIVCGRRRLVRRAA